MTSPLYRRILLKLSGEAFAGPQGYGIDPGVLADIAREIKEMHDLGIEAAVVVGGGNIFRARSQGEGGIERTTADYMGMLASALNALALQDALEKSGVPTRIQSAIEMKEIAEPYIRRRAMRHLEKGRVVIFAAGTGNPFFTTDTAAALRANEIGAEVIIKATNVDAIYEQDPKLHPDARKLPRLTHREAIRLGVGIIDTTAIALAEENGTPIVVYGRSQRDGLRRIIFGEQLGSVISSDPAGKKDSK